MKDNQLANVQKLIYLLLLFLTPLWILTVVFQWLNIFGIVDSALRNAARAEMVEEMRSLCIFSFWITTMLLVIAVALIIIIRRIKNDATKGR
jgi:uncharacterized membrane protein